MEIWSAGDEGFGAEVAGPLLQEVVVLRKISSIHAAAGALGMGEGHDEHVAAFLKWLHLVVPKHVTCCVRVVRS